MKTWRERGLATVVGTVLVVTALSMATAYAANEIVPVNLVGGVANAADTTGYGSVGYEYLIGKYEVTAGEYAAFLNSVAASDPHGLYDTDMDLNGFGCQITRIGSPGSYTYDFSGRPINTTVADWEDRPVNFVSWEDAARYCNWLTTGNTETGAYTFVGGVLQSPTPARSWSLQSFVLPTEDEWYKAAFYTDAMGGSYYLYPTGTNTAPTSSPNILSGYPTNPDPGNVATFDGDGIGLRYYRTEVGAHENSASPYATFDQAGNIAEWIEVATLDTVRGGSFISTTTDELSSTLGRATMQAGRSVGFRIAFVPEPGSLMMLSFALFGLCFRSRRS